MLLDAGMGGLVVILEGGVVIAFVIWGILLLIKSIKIIRTELKNEKEKKADESASREEIHENKE